VKEISSRSVPSGITWAFPDQKRGFFEVMEGCGYRRDFTMSELAVSPSACVPPKMTLIGNTLATLMVADRQSVNEEVNKLESQLAEFFGGVVECPRWGKMDDMT